MNTVLTTPRCILREIDPAADARPFYELNLDPEVVRWVGDGPFESIEATRAVYEEYVRTVYPTGFGRWTVVEKETGSILGWCGLKLVEGEIDLGYRFARAYWGRGFATETARACVDWGFRERKVERLVAWVDPANVASVRVLQKLAFQRVGERRIDSHLVDFYERRLRGGTPAP